MGCSSVDYPSAGFPVLIILALRCSTDDSTVDYPRIAFVSMGDSTVDYPRIAYVSMDDSTVDYLHITYFSIDYSTVDDAWHFGVLIALKETKAIVPDRHKMPPILEPKAGCREFLAQ